MTKEELPILSQAINYRVKEFDSESLKNVLKELNELINKLNNNIQNLIENISLTEKFIFLRSKKYFNHKSEDQLSKEFIASDRLLKFNIKEKIYNFQFGIGTINNNFGYEVFLLCNKEKVGKNNYSFFIIFNKKYKPLLDNNKSSSDSKKHILSNLIVSSISETILLSLNINNIKKDRFLENALLNLLYSN